MCHSYTWQVERVKEAFVLTLLSNNQLPKKKMQGNVKLCSCLFDYCHTSLTVVGMSSARLCHLLAKLAFNLVCCI